MGGALDYMVGQSVVGVKFEREGLNGVVSASGVMCRNCCVWVEFWSIYRGCGVVAESTSALLHFCTLCNKLPVVQP